MKLQYFTNKTIFFGILLGLLASVPSMAKHYGAAGCGLGSMMFTSNSKGSQVTAATTNDSSSKVSAITSGTSGCTDGSHKSAAVQFIEINRFALANDVAKGGGEVLSSFLKLNNCTNGNGIDQQVQSQNIGKVLQKNFGKIFPSQNADSRGIYDQLQILLGQEKLCHLIS